MKCVINLDLYFKDYVSKVLWKKTSALAQVMPEILSDYFPQLTLLNLEKKSLRCLEDQEGKRWKVWCSRDNHFDLSPSLTKGHGRSKDGVDILYEAKKNYSGCIFVNLKDINNVVLRFKDWNSLEVTQQGKVSFDE
jgi:hypothetical protein